LTIDEARLRDFDQPVTAHVEFEVPGHFTGNWDLEGSLADNKLWGKLLDFNLHHGRQTPLDLGHPFELRTRYVVELPPAYRFDGDPPARKTPPPWPTFTRPARLEPGQSRRLTLEFHTRLEKSRVEPAALEAFRQFQDEVTGRYRVYLTLKQARGL